MEGGRRRSGPLLLWGGGDPRQKAGEGARGGEGRVRWAGGWWQEWRRWGGDVAWCGESNCVERAECSGPAVCSPFISALCVTYNLPGCQASRSPRSPSSTLTDPPPPPASQPPSLCILHLSGDCAGAPPTLLSGLCILPGLLFCRHKTSTTGYFAEKSPAHSS